MCSSHTETMAMAEVEYPGELGDDFYVLCDGYSLIYTPNGLLAS